MRRIDITVAFGSWFRVGAAYPVDGIDVAVDHEDPLPAEHLRGLMRAEARWLASLGVGSTALIDEVFGRPAQPSPWAWRSVVPADRWTFSSRHRVSIDPERHAAISDHLVGGEVAWAKAASFSIVQAREVAGADVHERLLRVAACAVHHVGAWRRRGLGEVLVATDPLPTRADVDALRAVSGTGGAR